MFFLIYIQHKNSLKDQEINIYPDLAQKHLETYMILVDERRKIYKNLKNLLTEISQMVESFTKSLQKNSKTSSISNLGLSSPYYKRLNTFFETFSTTYDSIGKKLANLGLFMGIKVSTLENILKEHKNYEKTLSSTVTRIIKDINLTKQNLAKGIQNHEKFVFSMGEAEKMKNEVKYLQNKREAEECNEANKEILTLLRKMIYDASNVFSTAYKEFRNHEQLNLHSIKMILEGVNNQFMLSLEEIQETVKLSSDFFQKKFEMENEIKILISLDSALTNYENIGENGKIEDEEFVYEPFIVPIEYASISNANNTNNNNNGSINKIEIIDKKSETNESNIEDNDKFSEKSLEKSNTNEEDPVLAKKEQNSEESLDKTIERNINSNSNNNNNSIIITDSSKETNEILKETNNNSIINNSNNMSIIHTNSCNNNNTTPMKELRDSRENLFIKDASLKAIEKTQSSKIEAETTTEEWKSLETRFNLSAQDKFITSYACAFAQKILLQGRLYVFNTRLCFHSYFNAQTLFGNTKLNIPIDDIIRFEKRTNALFFNNAIAVITKNGELFFASFMSRDTTFDALSKLLPQNIIKNGQNIPLKLDYLSDSKKTDVLNTTDQEIDGPNHMLLPKKDAEEVISDGKNSRKFKRKSTNAEQLHKLSLNLTTDPKPQQVLLFQERKQRLEKLLIPIKNYKETVSHTFNDANLKDLLISLFSMKSEDFQVIKHKGNNYCNFFELFLHENKEENVNIGIWDPIPPKYFRFMDNFEFEELLNYADFSTMEISFQHPIKERVIFAPKFSHCNDKYQIFWISYEEIVIQVSTHFSKIPFGDYFIVRKAYFFKENKEKNQVEMTVRFYVDMVKSTVFQSRIEKSTAEETKEFYLEVFIPMALKTHKEYMHKVKDKYGNDSLNSRVLVMKKNRKSTKETAFLEQGTGILNNKEKEKDSAFLVPKEMAGSSQKVDFIVDNRESREIKEQIKEVNEKISEFMKDAEKERKLLLIEIQTMKHLLIGIIIFAFLITIKGIF